MPPPQVSVRLNHAALREIRKRTGLTQGALAEAADVARPTLVNLEAGRRNTSWQTARALATALRCEVTAILADPDTASDEPAATAAAAS